MFGGSPPLTAAQARDYYEQEYSRGDYDPSNPAAKVSGEWFGRSAARLGLTGPVRKEDFAALLEGKAGESRPGLIPSASSTGRPRAGWDFTCGADKSVSLVALVGGDPAVAEAHRKAADKGLTELERFAQVRSKQGQRETTASIVAAIFEHDSSRRLDPQLHTHCVVMNMTERSDGAWRALETRQMFAALELATTTYRAEMARELERLGYPVVVRPGGGVGIDEFTSEQLGHFSQRGSEIAAYLAKRGLSGNRAAHLAAMRTRGAKVRDIDRPALLAAWRERAQNLGIDLQRVREIPSQDPPFPGELARAAARESVAFAVVRVSETRAVFQERELEVAALQQGMGRIVLEEVRGAIREQEGIIRVTDPRIPSDLLTTENALRLELRNIAFMRAGRHGGRWIERSFEPSSPLSPDQERVVRFVLGSRDQVLGVKGKAGPDLVQALSAIREVAAGRGWVVKGVAPRPGAARLLAEAAIEVKAAAALAAEGSSGLKGRELWVVAEAGFLTSRLAKVVLEKAAHEAAKVVLVADPRQLHTVEGGTPFAYLYRAGLRTEDLHPFRPSQDRTLREVLVRVWAGQFREAASLLEAKDRILEIADRGERLRAIVSEVRRAPETLVIAPGQDERRELNRLLRDEFIAAGKMEEEGVLLAVAVEKRLTATERGEACTYEVGDRLQFRRGSRVYGIERGCEARVKAVDLAGERLVIETKDGRVFSYPPQYLHSATVSAVEERPFTAGDRVQLGEVLLGSRVARGELGTIRRLDETGVRIRLDRGRRVTLKLGEGPLALDHAYAIRSPGALGRSVDRVLLAVDTSRGRETITREEFFLSLAKARRAAFAFTDSRKNLLALLRREVDQGSGSSLRQSREGRMQNEGDRLHPGPARPADGRGRATSAGAHGPDRGRQPAIGGRGGEFRGPLPHAPGEGTATRLPSQRAGEAARGAGRAGAEARGHPGAERGGAARPVRAPQRVPEAGHGTLRARGGHGAQPGGGGGRAAARAGAAGLRGVAADVRPAAQLAGGDDRPAPRVSGSGGWVRALEVGGRTASPTEGRSRAAAPESRERTGQESPARVPTLKDLLARVRDLERQGADRATPEAEPERSRAPERER
jgi:conjugative relaxase-like TrwC/TraI family protein